MHYKTDIFVCWECQIHWDESVIDAQDQTCCPNCGDVIETVVVESE